MSHQALMINHARTLHSTVEAQIPMFYHEACFAQHISRILDIDWEPHPNHKKDMVDRLQRKEWRMEHKEQMQAAARRRKARQTRQKTSTPQQYSSAADKEAKWSDGQVS